MLKKTVDAKMDQVDMKDDMMSPVLLHEPFNIILDWWTDKVAGGKRLKVWAGSMRCFRIAKAMRQAMADIHHIDNLFDYHTIVYDPEKPKKKVEPYYFDCRRGWNAKSLDIGFAPDKLKMTTAAFPAVEFLCLVGLQRFRPATAKARRMFEYYTWTVSFPPSIAALSAGGIIEIKELVRYRFENGFRTDKEKHKSFLPGTKTGVKK